MTTKVPRELLVESYATSAELTTVANDRYTKTEADTRYTQESELDTRLGTAGNLGTMAQETATDYFLKGAIPPIIWTGNTNSVTQSTLGNPGAGLYLIKVSTLQAGAHQATIYWDGVSTSVGLAYHDTELIGATPRSLATYTVTIGSTGIVTSKKITYDANGDDGIGAFTANMSQIRKL